MLKTAVSASLLGVLWRHDHAVGRLQRQRHLAAGWTIIATQTSTTALVASKESPRTDGFNSGERQRMVFTTTVAGGATKVYQMYKVCTGVAAGDVVQFEVTYELMSHVGVTAINLQLRQDAGTPIQSAFDNSPVNTPMPNIAHKGVLRTPPMTLQPGTASVTAFIQVPHELDQRRIEPRRQAVGCAGLEALGASRAIFESKRAPTDRQIR
ncbi:hypothetical protein [uncultured Reyranella sp.]|uniref:hypothetical protein n=1 Tax=uncultured Reyranella sp. TaxID=735512 RepID=UPI00259D043E|nr:hypothetical protein [uncultured Reyranella sp.]